MTDSLTDKIIFRHFFEAKHEDWQILTHRENTKYNVDFYEI